MFKMLLLWRLLHDFVDMQMVVATDAPIIINGVTISSTCFGQPLQSAGILIEQLSYMSF
jgi:hypothetical protein